MSETTGALSPDQIRTKILRGYTNEFPACIAQLAGYATDTTFTGFEDPRSASIESFAYGRQKRTCPRRGCGVAVRLDLENDTYEMSGICPLAETCTKKNWDEDPSTVDEVSIRRASSEVLSFICAQADCGYNCGFVIDGNAGSAGSCKRGE